MQEHLRAGAGEVVESRLQSAAEPVDARLEHVTLERVQVRNVDPSAEARRSVVGAHALEERHRVREELRQVALVSRVAAAGQDVMGYLACLIGRVCDQEPEALALQEVLGGDASRRCRDRAPLRQVLQREARLVVGFDRRDE